MKLYTSKNHPRQWIAYVPDAGWLVFPDTENGWEERRPVRGLDPIHLREVPSNLASHSGFGQPAVQPSLKKVA